MSESQTEAEPIGQSTRQRDAVGQDLEVCGCPQVRVPSHSTRVDLGERGDDPLGLAEEFEVGELVPIERQRPAALGIDE
jgi:hypothetical protein